jgi:hypothetical protein
MRLKLALLVCDRLGWQFQYARSAPQFEGDVEELLEGHSGQSEWLANIWQCGSVPMSVQERGSLPSVDLPRYAGFGGVIVGGVGCDAIGRVTNVQDMVNLHASIESNDTRSR